MVFVGAHSFAVALVVVVFVIALENVASYFVRWTSTIAVVVVIAAEAVVVDASFVAAADELAAVAAAAYIDS